MLLTNVAERLQAYEHDGMHYHLAATGIYAARAEIGNVLSVAYHPYIIAGLIAYDMARQLGTAPYRQFAARLQQCLDILRPTLTTLLTSSLATVDIDACGAAIAEAYETLAAKGSAGLHVTGTRHFYVGASKILHWLNPELFLILDGHIATAFHHHPDPNARVTIYRAGAPQYSSQVYLQCLRHAQREILTYGEARLRCDGNELPLANIYGNVAFQYAVALAAHTSQ